MTDNNHPIIPPQELMQQWLRNYFGTVFNGELSDLEKYLVTQASQWGYEKRGAVNESELQKARDEELEACCKWLDFNYPYVCITMLRADRRPEPKSLAEEGYDALDTYIYGNPDSGDKERTYNALRRALKRLQELEGQDDG
jgi:hypothetical protein